MVKSIERFPCIGAVDDATGLGVVGVVGLGVCATGLGVGAVGFGVESVAGVCTGLCENGVGIFGACGVFGCCVSFIIMYKYKNLKGGIKCIVKNIVKIN